MGDVDVEPLGGEPVGDRRRQVLFVLDHQYAHRRIVPVREPPRVTGPQESLSGPDPEYHCGWRARFLHRSVPSAARSLPAVRTGQRRRLAGHPLIAVIANRRQCVSTVRVQGSLEARPTATSRSWRAPDHWPIPGPPTTGTRRKRALPHDRHLRGTRPPRRSRRRTRAPRASTNRSPSRSSPSPTPSPGATCSARPRPARARPWPSACRCSGGSARPSPAARGPRPRPHPRALPPRSPPRCGPLGEVRGLKVRAVYGGVVDGPAGLRAAEGRRRRRRHPRPAHRPDRAQASCRSASRGGARRRRGRPHGRHGLHAPGAEDPLRHQVRRTRRCCSRPRSTAR